MTQKFTYHTVVVMRTDLPPPKKNGEAFNGKCRYSNVVLLFHLKIKGVQYSTVGKNGLNFFPDLMESPEGFHFCPFKQHKGGDHNIKQVYSREKELKQQHALEGF